MNLKVTGDAFKRVAELIEKDKTGKIALRVAVDGGGCSGFMYKYDLVDAINEDDDVIEQDGVKVIIDPLSQQFLNDCTVEFIQELGSAYFQISNPNASAKCGCGSSFAI
jgi:iron-sulfur cluster assembly accessory protein